jgi:ketosteroid isomerase-like protein
MYTSCQLRARTMPHGRNSVESMPSNPEAETDPRREDVVEIEVLLEKLEQAVVDGDLGALELLLGRDVQSIFSGGATPVQGRKAVLEVWQKHLAEWGDVKISRRDTVVRIHGDVAWAHFVWDGEGSADSERYRLEGERWTVVMMWEEGAWRLAQTHTSMPYRDWESHRV